MPISFRDGNGGDPLWTFVYSPAGRAGYISRGYRAEALGGKARGPTGRAGWRWRPRGPRWLQLRALGLDGRACCRWVGEVSDNHAVLQFHRRDDDLGAQFLG